MWHSSTHQISAELRSLRVRETELHQKLLVSLQHLCEMAHTLDNDVVTITPDGIALRPLETFQVGDQVHA